MDKISISINLYRLDCTICMCMNCRNKQNRDTPNNVLVFSIDFYISFLSFKFNYKSNYKLILLWEKGKSTKDSNNIWITFAIKWFTVELLLLYRMKLNIFNLSTVTVCVTVCIKTCVWGFKNKSKYPNLEIKPDNPIRQSFRNHLLRHATHTLACRLISRSVSSTGAVWAPPWAIMIYRTVFTLGAIFGKVPLTP